MRIFLICACYLTVVNAALNPVGKTHEGFGSVFKMGSDVMGEGLQSSYEFLSKIPQGVANLFGRTGFHFSFKFKWSNDGYAKIWEQLTEAQRKVVSTGAEGAASLVRKAAEAAGQLKDGASEAEFDTLFKGFISDVGRNIQQNTPSLLEAAGKIGDEVQGAADVAVSGSTGGRGGFAVLNSLEDGIEDVLDVTRLDHTVKGVGKGVETVVGSASNAVTGAVKGISSGGKGFLDNLGSGNIFGALGSVAGAVSSVVQGVGDIATGVLTGGTRVICGGVGTFTDILTGRPLPCDPSGGAPAESSGTWVITGEGKGVHVPFAGWRVKQPEHKAQNAWNVITPAKRR